MIVGFTPEAKRSASTKGPISSDKPSFSATQTAQMTTVVSAINHETREITLTGPQGNSRTITADPEQKGLDQIHVGDIVNVEYLQNVSIDVMANDGMEPAVGAMEAVGRSGEGEAPGAMVVDTQVVTATVHAIDIEANTFKLQWPTGEIREYVAQDPENLKKADVGDLVVISTTEALAIYLADVPEPE